MKKLLFLVCFLAAATCASAQIGYQQTYNNLLLNQQGQQQQYQQRYVEPQPSTKSYRTTAYLIDNQGNVYKMPILVEVTVGGYGGRSMRVTQKYVNTGLGGRWDKIYCGSSVSECRPLVNSNPLESEFMYKATIDTNTWYFDL